MDIDFVILVIMSTSGLKDYDRAVSSSGIFPMVLHRMLMDLTASPSEVSSEIITWSDNGDAFIIYNQNQFEKLILPRYFRTGRFRSFQRQLTTYGFKRTNLYASHKDVYVYQHQKFHRDHPELINQVRQKPRASNNEASTESKLNNTAKYQISESATTPPTKLDSKWRRSDNQMFEYKIKSKGKVSGKDLTLNNDDGPAAAVGDGDDDNDDNHDNDDDDCLLQLPVNSSTNYSLSDWDVTKEEGMSGES